MYKFIRDIDQFYNFSIDSHSPVFCDTETCVDESFSSGGLYGKIRLVQLYQSHWDEAIIIDCFFIPLLKVLELLSPHTLVFHNAAFDLHTINLKTLDTWLPKNIKDTLYLSRLKYYTKIKFSFYDCLNHAGLNDSLIDSINKKEEQKSDWSGPLSVKQKTYAACDVIYLEKLYNNVKESQNSTIYNLDIENLKLAVKYSRHGMPIDQSEVTRLKKKYINKLENVLDELPINPRSSVQACKYLGTSSSASDILTNLVYEGNTKAKQIQDARHYYKSLEYLKAYDRPKVKGFFQPCTSLSGRFSCTGGNRYDHVNLQQMPEHLHSVVVAPEDYVIIYKDYSGLELRMAVAYTGEPTMSSMMKEGQDMHTETAKYIFNKQNVTDEERTVAKTLNFGLIYGGGIPTIQATLKLEANVIMSFTEVRDIVNKWFDMYYYFKEWQNLVKHNINVYGYMDVETALGRKVRTYKITDALNLPIQGSSAEVTKVSIAMLHNQYPDAYLIDTIHDSNILLSKKHESQMWGNRLNKCMIDAWKYVTEDLVEPDIPMPSGYESGKVWTFH